LAVKYARAEKERWKMKKCKRCKGKGFVFEKTNSIWTGKVDKYFGMEIPRIVDGYEQTTCRTCWGKGR